MTALKKRIDEYDIIKGLAIIMVVAGHASCPQLLHNMFYLVHMPLFFIVSGCTIRGGDNFKSLQDVIVFCKKKILSFYLPFLMFVIPICLLHNLIWDIGLYENRYDIHQYIIQMIRCLTFSIGQTEPFLPQLWFLKSLFLAEILYVIIHYACNRIKVSYCLLVLSFICLMVILSKESIPHFIEVNVIWPVKAWLFIELGVSLKKINGKRHIALLVFPFLLAWSVVGCQLNVSFQHSYGLVFLLQFGMSILAYCSFYTIARLIKKKKWSRLTFCHIGQKSLYVFFWHYVVFAIINVVYGNLFASSAQMILHKQRCLDDVNWVYYVLISISAILLGEYAYRKVLGLVSLTKK